MLNIKYIDKKEEIEITASHATGIVEIRKGKRFIEFNPVLSYSNVEKINSIYKDYTEMKDGKLVDKEGDSFDSFIRKCTVTRLLFCLTSWSSKEEIKEETIYKDKNLKELLEIADKHIIEVNKVSEKEDEKETPSKIA